MPHLGGEVEGRTVLHLWESRASTRSLPRSVPKCFTCGEAGHFQAKCKKQICYSCNKPGHIAKNCKVVPAPVRAPRVKKPKTVSKAVVPKLAPFDLSTDSPKCKVPPLNAERELDVAPVAKRAVEEDNEKKIGGFSSLPGKVRGRTTRNSTKQMVSGGNVPDSVSDDWFRQQLEERVREQEEQGIVRAGVAKEGATMEVVDDEKKRDEEEPPTT